MGGGEPKATTTTDSSLGWKYNFCDLEIYDNNNNEIEYTVTCTNLEKYDMLIDGYDIQFTLKKGFSLGNNNSDTTNSEQSSNENSAQTDNNVTHNENANSSQQVYTQVNNSSAINEAVSSTEQSSANVDENCSVNEEPSVLSNDKIQTGESTNLSLIFAIVFMFISVIVFFYTLMKNFDNVYNKR